MEKEYAVLIGYRIRQERVQRNISQPEMADILGISYSYYNNIEKGNRSCPIFFYNRIGPGRSIIILSISFAVLAVVAKYNIYLSWIDGHGFGCPGCDGIVRRNR